MPTDVSALQLVLTADPALIAIVRLSLTGGMKSRPKIGKTFHNVRCTNPLRGSEPVAKVCSPIARMLDLKI